MQYQIKVLRASFSQVRNQEASSCLLQRSWCLGDTPRFLALMVSVYRVGLRSYVHIYMAGPMLSGVAYIEICTDNVDPRLTLFQTRTYICENWS